jgi:hypothetical protein
MSHSRRFFLLTFLLVLPAWAGPNQTTEQQVLHVEQIRVAALLQGDTKQLDQVLAEELTYTHSSGRTDTKAELLASISSGKLKYESIEPVGTKARVYGSTAVVTGQATLKVHSNGQPQSFGMKFTGVYAKRDGRWQLVAYQSTRLAQ